VTPKLSDRKVRLRAAWVLAVLFLLFARPTPPFLLAGGSVALIGLWFRGWAAGHIRKEAALAVGGPYAYTRNPLYAGSFLIGTGVALAGGRWLFVALFLAFFFLVYSRTATREARELEERFGEEYRSYARAVPLYFPRLAPWRPVGGGSPPTFSMDRYRANREWEAGLGVVGGLGALALKMILFP